MTELFASPLAAGVTVALILMQGISFAFLLVVAFEYRHLFISRSQLYVAVGSGALKKKGHIFLFGTYVLSILLASFLIDLLYLFQPHVLR